MSNVEPDGIGYKSVIALNKQFEIIKLAPHETNENLENNTRLQSEICTTVGLTIDR